MENKKAEARARANQTSSHFYHNIINETKSNKATSKRKRKVHWPGCEMQVGQNKRIKTKQVFNSFNLVCYM